MAATREPVTDLEGDGARVNMRLPQTLLDEVKRAAERTGVPYQRFIRHALERALQSDPASRMRHE
jgi:predicted DNA binding CopG/RHH family protein